MNTEKLNAIFEDKAFVETLFAMESVAEVQAALKEKGVELTEEEILGIRELLTKVESGEVTLEHLKQLDEGELSEELLEQVSGGILLIGSAIVITKVACMIAGAVAGAAGAGVGTYFAIRNRW